MRAAVFAQDRNPALMNAIRQVFVALDCTNSPTSSRVRPLLYPGPMVRPLPPARASEAGFSATELLIVATMCVTLAAITAGAFGSATSSVQGDADMQVIQAQIKLARETAINQRRAVEIRFVAPNQIQVVRRNIPAGTTTLSTAFLEHHAAFRVFPTVPDTPDGFGKASATDFGGVAAMMFTADGMFTDAAGTPVNGTVFIGQMNKPLTARAVTVFGPTAMIRAYRWNGTAWRR